MVRNYIVADVGGTHIRAARFPTQNPKPTTIKRILTQGQESPHARLIKLIESLIPDDEEISAITIAAPGPCEPIEGIIYEAPNIPGWTNLPLKKLIQEHFNIPVAIGNDANLAALGEWRYGAGIGHHHLVYITVSTGIGAGVIINDQLLLGYHGLAAELGHTTVIPDGPLCGCGKKGHLEAVTSGPSIARWAEQELKRGVPSSLPVNKQITAKDVSLAANQGDKLSQDALARAGTYLGIAIADLLHVFNPSIVIIGGGVSQCGDAIFSPIRAAMIDHVISPKYLDGLTVTTCSLGDEVGLIGGLVLAQTLDAPSPCP
jgi:glucokinase